MDRHFDTKYGAECESRIIYDGRGVEHTVSIRRFFPKSIFNLDQVVSFGEEFNKRYLAIREMICPKYLNATYNLVPIKKIVAVDSRRDPLIRVK